MGEANKIDANSLQEEARRSGDREAFTVLTRMPGLRIGVGARLENPATPIFFIEILVSLCTDHDHVNLDIIERKLSLLIQLKKRGYLLTCEEDGSLSCELAVPSEGLEAECEAANSITGKYLG